MKKNTLLIFTIITTCWLLLPGQAAGISDYISINDLNMSIPQIWQQTYKSNTGINVGIHVDIEVPKISSYPILQVSEGNLEYFPAGNKQETLVVYPNAPEGSFMVYLNAPNGDWNEKGEKTNKPEWKNAATQSIYWLRPWEFGRSYVDNNNLTLADANSFFQERVASITNNILKYDLDLLLTKGIFQVDSWKGQKPILGQQIGQSYYTMNYSQALDGIPILGDAAIIGMSEKFRGSPPPCPMPGNAEISIASANEYIISVRPNEKLKTLYTDVPLCTFEKVKKTIEGLIIKGNLRHISSLRLGYVLFADPNEPPYGVAYPMWVLKGDWYNRPNDKTPWYHEFTPAKDGYIGYYAQFAAEIMINAQTGELMNDITKPEELFVPHIITWDQIQWR